MISYLALCSFVFWIEINDTPETEIKAIFMDCEMFYKSLVNDKVFQDLVKRFSAVCSGLDLSRSG